MRAIRRATLIVVAIATLGLGLGCGGSDDAAERPQVRSAFDDLLRDFAARDGRAVCRSISRRARRQVGFFGHETPTLCWRDIRDIFAWYGKRNKPARPLRIEIDGDRASVFAVLAGGSKGVMPFVREDERWKLDSLYGVTAPPPPGLE